MGRLASNREETLAISSQCMAINLGHRAATRSVALIAPQLIPEIWRLSQDRPWKIVRITLIV